MRCIINQNALRQPLAPSLRHQLSRTATSFQNSEIHFLAAIRSSFEPPRKVQLPSRNLTNFAWPK
jgi:hypothetical protein